MEREQAIAEVRNNWRRLFAADKKNKGIVCPLCGSGSGSKGTGITGDRNHGKPNSLKCWSCGFTGDAITKTSYALCMAFFVVKCN